MVIDTSALLATLEAAIVVEARLGEAGGRELDELLSTAQVTIMPFTTDQAAIARQAYRTYGKGRHPAGRNYRDCFSYALAKTSGEALLCKGNDFSQTEVTPWRFPQQEPPPA